MSVVLGQVAYEPIRPARLLNGAGVPYLEELPEKATQTFKIGVPLVLNGGYVQEASFGSAETILGVSVGPGQNLSVDGTAQDLSEGTPPNQPNAKIIPVGAWPRRGKTHFCPANDQVVWSAALKLGQVWSDALIVPATHYVIEKDGTSGFWYIDSLTTAGNAAVVKLIDWDRSSPNTATGGVRVFFQFKADRIYYA